jgi:hypothetical protein
MATLSLRLATAGFTVAILAFPAKADALGPVDIEIGARAGGVAGPVAPLLKWVRVSVEGGTLRGHRV